MKLGHQSFDRFQPVDRNNDGLLTVAEVLRHEAGNGGQPASGPEPRMNPDTRR
jgi:hypothetical protein